MARLDMMDLCAKYIFDALEILFAAAPALSSSRFIITCLPRILSFVVLQYWDHRYLYRHLCMPLMAILSDRLSSRTARDVLGISVHGALDGQR